MAVPRRYRHAAHATRLVTSTAAFVLLAPPAFASPEARRACIARLRERADCNETQPPREAREAASACLADTCPSALRADCGNWLKDVEARLPSVVVECQEPAGKLVTDVRLSLDGAPWKERPDGIVNEIDPGDHVVRAERGGRPPVEVHVLVSDGKKAQRIVIDLPGDVPEPPHPTAGRTPLTLVDPPPTDRAHGRAPVPAAAYALGGLGALALGGFVFFAVKGKDAEHGLDSWSLYDDGRLYALDAAGNWVSWPIGESPFWKDKSGAAPTTGLTAAYVTQSSSTVHWIGP
jgi:hypothetical protein